MRAQRFMLIVTCAVFLSGSIVAHAGSPFKSTNQDVDEFSSHMEKTIEMLFCGNFEEARFLLDEAEAMLQYGVNDDSQFFHLEFN